MLKGEESPGGGAKLATGVVSVFGVGFYTLCRSKEPFQKPQ